MGLVGGLFKIIFFPFYILRTIFTSKQYRIYLDQKEELQKQIREIDKARKEVKRQEEVDPDKIKMLDERQDHIKRAIGELRKTYRSQRRLDRKPTSMGRFRIEKRREKRLRKIAGKLE